MLPLILKVNEDIENEQQHLKRITTAFHANGSVGDEDARAWLHRLAVRYEVVTTSEELALNTSVEQLIATLRRRVDTIPPSLALAPRRQSKVVTGRRVSQSKVTPYTGNGALRRDAPTKRNLGHLSNFGVATFSSPLHSVAAYARNLNTFPAYSDFRDMARPTARQQYHPKLAGAGRYPYRIFSAW